MKGTTRGLALAGISLGALVAATGCGLTTAGHLTAAPPRVASHVSSPMAQPAHASPAASQPVAPSPAAAPSNAPPAAPSAPTAAGYEGPHFTSPEAAMTYLAAEYNSGDTAALRAVTTPNSYLELTQMWSGPVNLQLQHCTVDGNHGDYYCYMSHDYPNTLHKTSVVTATMLVAPALNPGWYLYAIPQCG